MIPRAFRVSFAFILLIAQAFTLSDAAISHELTDEQDGYLTTDICERNNVIRVAPNRMTDLAIELIGPHPLVILVPGTAAEDGCAKQFRSIIRQLKNGNNIVSMDYYEERLFGDFTGKNKRDYDWSVDLGVKALKKLLNATDAADIRVFGHSKGSHIVSHVASLYEDDNRVKFWAFAQPQRVSSSKSQHRGKLGKRGFIEKSTTNLVTINWHNDEVWYLKDSVGAKNAWKYPGEVNDPETSGGTNANRFDHHNNYGGHYTEKACPYYPTGDDSRYNDPDEDTQNKLFCDTRTVEFHPYFWGDQRCFDLAMAAHYQPRTDGNGTRADPEQIWPAGTASRTAAGVKVGTRHYIGTSGPRGPNCGTLNAMQVDIQIRYRYKYRSGNGKGFSIRFRDFNRFEANGSTVITAIKQLGKDKESGEWVDTPWERKMLPNSFIFQIDPLSAGAKNSRNNTIDIAWVKARITDPLDPSRKIYRYVVGPQCTGRSGGFPCNDKGLTPFEGQDQVAGYLQGSNVAGWNKFEYRDVANMRRRDVSNWRMKKSTARRGRQILEVLKFTGNADDSTAGFYKFYSLLD